MNDHEIVLAIQRELDGQEWDIDMLDWIADLLTQNGYPIRDIS